MSLFGLGFAIIDILRQAGSEAISQEGTYNPIETQISEQLIITDDGTVIHAFIED